MRATRDATWDSGTQVSNPSWLQAGPQTVLERGPSGEPAWGARQRGRGDCRPPPPRAPRLHSRQMIPAPGGHRGLGVGTREWANLGGQCPCQNAAADTNRPPAPRHPAVLRDRRYRHDHRRLCHRAHTLDRQQTLAAVASNRSRGQHFFHFWRSLSMGLLK